MKDIFIIAPMLNSLDGLEDFAKKIKHIGKDKYNLKVAIYHIDEVPKKYNRNKNLEFVKADFSDNFDSCVTKGFEISNGDAVVVFDTYDPKAFDNLDLALNRFENGAEIVLTKRKKEAKNIFSKFFRYLYSKMLSFAKLDEELFVNSNFGLFSKRASNIIKSFPDRNYYLRNFACFEDYQVELLEYQKTKKQSKSETLNLYFLMYTLSFALALSSILLLIFGINLVEINNQAFFSMIGITITFAGILFGIYNFHIWFLQKRTRLIL